MKHHTYSSNHCLDISFHTILELNTPEAFDYCLGKLEPQTTWVPFLDQFEEPWATTNPTFVFERKTCRYPVHTSSKMKKHSWTLTWSRWNLPHVIGWKNVPRNVHQKCCVNSPKWIWTISGRPTRNRSCMKRCLRLLWMKMAGCAKDERSNQPSTWSSAYGDVPYCV